MDPVEFARQRLLAALSEYLEAGGTQLGLAKAAGINQGTVSVWITKLRAGEIPKLDSIATLCGALDVPLASLFPPAPPALLTAAQSTPAHSPAVAELLEVAATLDEHEVATLLEVAKGFREGDADAESDEPGVKPAKRR